jgi:hypothetical protein
VLGKDRASPKTAVSGDEVESCQQMERRTSKCYGIALSGNGSSALLNGFHCGFGRIVDFSVCNHAVFTLHSK